MKKEKATNKSKKVKIILAIISIICLICAISYLVIHFINANKNKSLYDDLQENIIADETTEELSQVKSEFAEKVKELQKENADVKGWIQIADTNINYPLLQTTDNDYYLTHNYKKEKSSYGSIFIKNNCDIKNENGNIIIYRSLYEKWANVCRLMEV